MKQIFFFSALLIFVGFRAEAYPEFIGYGYASCMTCHFNGAGSGALNDYGRALWSGEIASRAFYSAKRTDEDIAESSGFFGKKQLPWMIRPGIKYRSLNYRTNYGSGSSSVERIFPMQVDLNLVLKADQEEKFIFYFTEGFRPYPSNEAGAALQAKKAYFPSGPANRWIGREYWLRYHMTENSWVYAGLMDKIFGLRNIDHTSYTRSVQEMGQYDQTLGLAFQRIVETSEVSVHLFSGNPDEAKVLNQKGFSLMWDKEIGDKKRFTLSYLNSKSELKGYQLTAFGYRGALWKGSSLLAEYGFRQENTVATSISKSGSWMALHSYIQLARGYNFHSSLERYNEEFKPSADDNWRWTLGMIMFPAPRLELRTDIVNKRLIKEQGAQDDNWSLQGQVHVSL